MDNGNLRRKIEHNAISYSETMSAFTDHYSRLVRIHGRLDGNAISDLAKVFDSGNAEDWAFFVPNVNQDGTDENERIFNAFEIATTLDDAKIEALKGIPDFLALLKSRIEDEGSRVGDANRVYSRLKILEIFQKDNEMIFGDLYDFLGDHIDDGSLLFFVNKFQEFRNIPRFSEAFIRYLATAGKDGRFAYVSSEMVTFISDEYRTEEYVPLFAEILNAFENNNLSPISLLSRLPEADIARLFGAIQAKGANGALQGILRAIVEKTFCFHSSRYESYRIYDFEKEVLASPIISKAIEIAAKGVTSFSFDLFRTVCDSGSVSLHHDAFRALLERTMTESDAEKFGQLFTETEYEKYHVWWFIPYDAIKWSSRTDKEVILTALGVRLGEKIDAREKTRQDWEKENSLKREARKQEFESNITAALEVLENNPDRFSARLLSEYCEYVVNSKKRLGDDNGIYEILSTDARVAPCVEKQVRTLLQIDPKAFNWRLLERGSNGSKWSTVEHIADGTYGRCLHIAKHLGIDLTPYRKNLAALLPFLYGEESELVSEFIGTLKPDEAGYLLGVYGGLRDDDLQYNNFFTFLRLLKRDGNLDIFTSSEVGEMTLENVLWKAVRDSDYNYSEREGAFEVLLGISPSEDGISTFFSEIVEDKNYFSDVLPSLESYGEEHTKWRMSFMANRHLIDKFQQEQAIEWILGQLGGNGAKIQPFSLDSPFARSISLLEDEIAWGLRTEEKINKTLGLIRNARYADGVNVLIVRAFDLLRQDPINYDAYASYLFRGIFLFYESLDAPYSAFQGLEKFFNDLEIDPSLKRKFLGYLDELFSVYRAKMSRADLDRARTTLGNPNHECEESLTEAEGALQRIGTALQRTEEEKKRQEDELNKLRGKIAEFQRLGSASGIDDIVLFVEGKDDKKYLQLAWETLEGQTPPFRIVPLGGCAMVGNALRLAIKEGHDADSLMMGMVDHDAFGEIESVANMKKDKKEICEPWNQGGYPRGFVYRGKKQWKFIFPMQVPNCATDEIVNQVYINGHHAGTEAFFEVEHLFHSQLFTESNCFKEEQGFTGRKRIAPDDKTRVKEKVIAARTPEEKKEMFKGFQQTVDLIKEIVEEWKTNKAQPSSPSESSAAVGIPVSPV